MAERPLYTLYKNLKAQNYDVPDDYNKFESALTRDGKGGADNRHAIYENLKAQNFDVPDTYERFYSALFEPRSKTSSRAKGGSVPMTAADRARFSAGAQAISASAQQTMNNAGRYNKLKQRKQKKQKDFGRVNLGTHQTPYGGDVNNVVKDDFAYNPETGKAGAYVTSDNENAYTQNDAEQKQNLLDKYGEEWSNAVDMGIVPSELDKADPDLSDTDVAMRQMERRQEWLNENQDRRSKELNESMHLQGSPFVASGGAVAPSSFNTAISNEANLLSDVEYGAYNTAKAYNQMLRTTLLQELKEQKQRNENAGWWKDKWNDVSNYFGAMFNTMLDPKLYSQGVMDAAISNNLLQVKKGMEDGTIKKGSNAGNAAQAMLGAIQQQQAEAAKQQQYGTKAYQYGDMSGRSLKFAGDFAFSGWRNVMTTGFTKAGEKVGEKMALGALGKWFTKNTGRVLGDIAGSAALAATNQLGSTYNNVIERYVGMNNENGGVTQGKNGDLKFNEGVSLGKAIKDGFGSATIENFSEMFGEYLPGAPKLLSKLGLSKVSAFFEKIGNNAYYKWLSNATNKSGIQGVMAEISEEEFGTALHAAWGDGDGSWSDFNVFTNPDAREKQIDTCLGMFYSVGFMQAPRTAVGAINAVQYFNIKHQVAKADKFGQVMFNDKWEEIKSKIDVTTNADLTKTVLDATRSDSMTAKQKGAVINYAMFLSKLRGFNQAADAKTKDKVEEGDTAPTLSNDLDDAYTEGHDADDADKHNIQLEQNDKANELAAMLHITPEQLHDMADEDLEAMTGQDDKLDQAIYDYQVSTAKYQGVMDGAQDEVDMAAHQAAMETDNMTDLSRGTVRKATIKATVGLEDYEVYIISGNIATHDDGSIDVGNSDDMIIYYDPTTGRKEHADAMMFADLIEELPAADVKAQAIIDAKENAIKNVAGIIDGTVEVGSQFSVTDADGTEHTYEVLADNGDGTAMITIDGNVPTELVKGENVQIPYSFADLQQMKDAEDLKRLEAAKTEREQMEKERAEQQTQETQQTEESQPSFDFTQILNDNGNVVLADVLGKDGNTKYPNSQLFLIRDSGAKAKVMELTSDGSIIPHAVNKKDVRTATTMTLDEYKQAFAGSSMIEDNSGTIEADRGGIEVEDNTQPLSETDADNVIAQMESSAETAPDLELTPDNWTAEFGEDGIVSTPIGDVKMGENQVAKLFEKGRSKEFGMIKPTLTNPDVIIEVPSHSADGNEERSSSYLFIKTFLGKNGKKVYYFKSVTIKKDGLEISISSHYDRAKRVKEALMKGKLLYRKNDGAQTEQNQPSTSVTTSQEDAAGSSESKDTNISANGNENNESLTFEDGTPIPVDENGETDLSQTDAAHAAEWYDNNLGEDADDWLDGEIKKAKKVLEQAQNKKVTGTKPSELVASKKEKEAAIADAQAHYDSAISIRDALKERQLAKVEDTAEGRKELIEKARRKFARLKNAVKNDAEAVAQLYNETVGSLLHRLYDGTGIDVTDTIPLTAEEYVASNLGAHSLNYEGTETSKGVKQETGLSREDFAKTQLLAADGKGTTIDNLVHSLWENRPSNLESLGTQDIRNALLSVITSGFKASEARNYIENLRIAQAENMLEEQKKAADNAAFADEQKAESEQQTETAPEPEEKTGEDNSDEITDEENEQTNENINAPEVPEDATDENPLGAQRDQTDLPFSARDNGTQQTTSERAADVEKNKVDDMKVVDNIVGQKTRKAFERLAKMMGANIQWQYSDKLGNGWIQETTDADGNVHRTIFITLDSSITEGAQFIFGHEMTHQIKHLNPAAYNELTQLVLDTYGSDAFDKAVDETMQRYSDAGFSGRARDYYAEEVVADAVGEMIRDLNLAHTLAMKMSHPLLAAIHEILQKIKLAFFGTEYSDVTKNIIRSIEQAYVKTAKGEITNSETGEDVSFSLRQKPEPKKKGIGYKVFVLKDGKLYPPMVANPNGAATPVGVWLDADAAPIAGESKTGRPQVKQGGKGTQGGSGKLAYRPGWHLGVVPYAIQFNRKDAEGNKTLFPKNFVFAEVEYAADVDYQEEARQEGINPSGKYQHSLAGLKHLPTDGYYMYRTNPNPETDPWVITGAMKVNRILTRAEQAELVKKAGREPQQIQEGDIVTDDVVNSINQEIANAPKFSLKVYHGSGADFTEFDFDHMGEGAGSQTFGWGGYVTSSKKIGKSYANLVDANAPHQDVEYVGNNAHEYTDVVAGLFNGGQRDYDDVKEFLQNGYNSDKDNARKKQMLEWFESTKPSDWKSVNDGKRNLYEVDIPEDNGSNYLDWDAPITDELIDKVAKALPSLRSFDIKDLKKDRTFDNLYKTISMRSVKDDASFNDDKAASKLLSSLGYTGIKYKAGRNFGGAEVGDTNYVIFKPEDMKITEHTKFSLKDPFKMSDNEKKERGDRLIKAPAIDVASGVIQKTADLSARKAAEMWWSENVEQPLVFNTEVGDVVIDEKSIKDSLAHRYNQAKLDSITSLPAGFGNSVYIGTISDFVRTRDNVQNHYFAYPINYDGQRNYVFCRAMQDTNKNRLYVHEVFVADKINEGNTLQTAASKPHGGIALYKEILANVLSAAKIDNSSETAKKNGEKVEVEEPKTFEEFLNHPSLKFSIKNEEQRRAAEDAYEYASKLRPNKYAQYALVDMSNPSNSPEYYEKKVLADRWRRFYNKAVHNELDDVYKDAWGNYKLFDLDRPFADQVNEVKGDVPSEFNAPDVVANKNADNESGAEYHEYKQGGLSSVTYEDRYKAFKQREANREKVAGLKKELKETEDSYNLKGKERAEYQKQLMKEYMDKHKMTEEYEIPDDVWEDLRSKSFEKYQDELDSLFNKYKDLDRQIKAVAEPRFSLKDEKTLAGVHNITEEKLRKALKLGGFANPSLAVIDTNKTGHDNFGEISFIAPSALLDKRTGNTGGTWITDAYTQRYPSVEREMSEKGRQKFNDWVDSLEYPSEAKAEIKRQAEDALSNNNAPAWELMYLKEKGIDIKEYDSRIDYRWKEIIKDHPTVEDILNSMNTDPELNEKVTGLAKHIIVDPIRGKISLEVRRKIYEETGVKMSSLNPQVRKQAKEIFERDYKPTLLDEDGNPKKEDIKKVVEDIVNEHNDTKKYDFYLSKVKASNYVNKNGLYDDFIKWQENKLDEFGTKNRIFRGYNNDGTRKYVPETLENVSKAMREDANGQTNGSEYTSFGSFIAKLASRVDSTDEMRANKDKLSSNEDKEEFYEKWSDVYYELAKFLYNDVFYGEQRLHDIVSHADPKKYAKNEYGITLTPTFMKKLDALKNAVQTELKSAYFETKYNRPLHLNEFAAAVVPDNLGEDVRKGIENAGLPMYDYDPNKEGDRSRAFNEAINSSDNIRFSLRYDKFEHDLNQWKKDNNLPKDAQRPTIPQRNAGESAVDFLRRVDEYRKQMALWKTAPTYEQHLLSDDTALGEFNRELQRGSVLKRIAFQDSMLAIRKAQEAIMKEVGVDRLNMAEDAYTAENRSHGKGKNEFEEYNNEFLQPLRKAYHQMKKILGNSYDNVRIYMMAKHGLERDAQMAFKKSLDADFEDVAQRSAAYRAYKGDMNRITNDSDLEFGRVDFNTWRQRDNALRTKYSPSYMDYRYDENGIAYDYSGLSALFGGSDFEEAAHKLVRDIESSHVAEVQDLWNATNAATKKILRDGYKAGMMSKDTYLYVRDMYSHYIPLRGWDGTTADQVWDYIGGGKGAFNQTLKTAHGRTSIADDPIAYIENMAESGILLNNKNWVKQHLMLLAQNHPTSLLTLSKAWYVKSTDVNGNEEWIPATPQITPQMNSNQVKAAIDAFEQNMEKMAQTGDATQKRDGLNIAYPQTHSEEREHEVRVMKDGEEYVIYVNGDPQLAQAMNNTRAHRVREIQSGKLDRAAAWLGRKMAAAYTSLSPLFIPSNYFRDLTMTLASTAIREDAKYNYLLRKNLATSWNLGFMLRDYQNGKLREKVSNGNATPKEQMFYDFMMNGGETGFVSSLDVEDLKKKFKNDLKDLDRWKTNPVKVGHTIMDAIEFLNRAIEDSNRFAVYMTSIQYGRSIDEAVNDAKDVTLNFNRKGTGEYGWQMIRNLYLFINPAVQSLQTLGALAKHHPFKFTAVTASWLASGVLVPIVNAALMNLFGGDDDKDKYWQFTKWDRRNNLIMWVPYTHEYVKIPLAQEFRAFYGVGDMIASKMMGGELAEESWNQYAEDLLGQVVDMLPLDPTGYDGNIAVSLMPNAIRPVFELAFNVDFTGKPLFKDTEYNKYDPNFTKAYVGTPDWLVRASRMVNSIGNDYSDVQQNSIDAFGDPRYNLNNPAVVDHVLSSYLGGAYTMGSQVLGLLTKSLNDKKEIKMADIPLLSKFVSNPDDRPVTKKQGDEFWDKKEFYDRAANTISKLKKQAKIDGDYSLLERFYGSEEYKKYKLYEKDVNDYKEARNKERAEESGDEYRPHQLNAEDIYKNHATPMDEFEDMKLKQLFEKLNTFKTRYDAIVDNAPNESDGYYNTNKAAIDAIDEISLDKQEISELKKGFLDDGKDAYNAEDMKQIRELRKKILAVLEKANKVVVANQKAKTEK